MPKKPEDQEIKPGQDYVMRPKTAEEKKKWEAADVPEYKIKIDLNEEQISRLKEQCFKEFEALKEERKSDKLEESLKDRDAQYDGQLAHIDNLDFQIDVRESKIKVDAIVRSGMEAFIPDSGDIVDVAPRPEESRKDGWVVAEKQQQFIDFAMDEEIKPEISLRKIMTSAAKKYVGIGKIAWELNTQYRRREEHWEAELVQVGTSPDGKPIMDNVGLRKFLESYPDAEERYSVQYNRLLSGKSVDIYVKYKEQVFNNPTLLYVPVEDFYVRNACDYNKGLMTEHLIAERKRNTYWELKKLEADEDWENVDELFIDGGEGDKDRGKFKDFMTREYKNMEFTTFFRINPEDEEETKIKCWFDEEKQTFLAAFQYFYYSIDCDYIGFWFTINDKGFFGNAESVMYDLLDTHIAQDALISLLLQAIYVRNVLTPITPSGSDIETMFLDHDWEHGKPLPIGDELVDDVNKALGFVEWPSMDMNGGLVMLEKLKRIGSDVTRVSDLTTGGESQIDPNAPAQKTMALLEQSGVGIRDYIKVFKLGFDIFATNLLQLYYQMSTGDRKYRIRAKSKQVTGQDVFATIRRDEMVVRTVVQSRATVFAFDKLNEKRESAAAYQFVQADPYAKRQPKVLYKALGILLSTFGGRWKTLADSDLPSPEEFDKQQLQVALQAVAMLFKAAKAQADTTGVPVDGREAMAQAPEAITKAQSEKYNPELIPKEEQQ